MEESNAGLRRPTVAAAAAAAEATAEARGNRPGPAPSSGRECTVGGKSLR